MAQLRKSTFRVMPLGATNMEAYLPCCYQDKTTGQFVWMNDTEVVGKGSQPIKKGIKMIKFDKHFPFFAIEVDPTSSEKIQQDQKEKIEFFKNFPRVAMSLPNGNINSFPSKNHQVTFASVYQNGLNKDEALHFNDQDFKYVDESAMESQNLKDFKRKQQVNLLLNSVSGDEAVMTNICYLLGVNPHGLDTDGIELALNVAVLEGTKENDFVNLMDTKDFKNPYMLYTNMAIVRGIITQTESGFYQYNGNPIAKKINEVAKHFEHMEYDWNALKLSLKEIGVEAEEPSEAPTEGKVKAVVKNKSFTTQSEEV